MVLRLRLIPPVLECPAIALFIGPDAPEADGVYGDRAASRPENARFIPAARNCPDGFAEAEPSPTLGIIPRRGPYT